MSKLKIGFIGGGGIAGAHLPHLAERSDVELTGLADVNPAASATAEKYGMAHFVPDYKDLLPLVDAVVICVPTFLHADVAIAAMQAGKAVFCEKPLARTLDQATAMDAARQASGSPLQVGFVRRFDDEWLAWREAVQAERIGRPVVWHDVSSHAGPSAPWFYRDAQGGGPFLDGCIHNFDFALHTFGPAEWVFCHGRTFKSEYDAIDTGTATVRFASGDELLLAWSWGLPTGVPAGRIFEIIGPQGSLTWPDGWPKEHFTISTTSEPVQVPYPANALDLAFKAQMHEFISVARGEATPRAGLPEGRAALELALGVLQSARTNEVVQL